MKSKELPKEITDNDLDWLCYRKHPDYFTRIAEYQMKNKKQLGGFGKLNPNDKSN